MEKFSKKNKEKFYSETKLINSYYYKSDRETNIVVASDIHYHAHVDKEIYILLVKYVRETNPDFVLLPGDQIETIDFIDDTKERDFFESIIKSMAEVAPVIIVPGNHEIGEIQPNKFLNRQYSYNAKAIKYFESLNRFNNVYFLNNEQTKIKDIMFLGFNPRLATYLKNNDDKTNNIFVEDYLKSGLKMAEADYNILLAHNPILFNNKSVQNSINEFKKTDLVVAGHLHDGYMPKILDKFLGNTSAGLFFTPKVLPYPGIWCRGVHDFGRGYIFISQGFRKWTPDLKIFNAFEKFSANDVEKLIISNPKILKKDLEDIKER